MSDAPLRLAQHLDVSPGGEASWRLRLRPVASVRRMLGARPGVLFAALCHFQRSFQPLPCYLPSTLLSLLPRSPAQTGLMPAQCASKAC